MIRKTMPALLGLLTAVAFVAQPVAAANVAVTIVDFAFTPLFVEVQGPQATITFTNIGIFPHHPHSNDVGAIKLHTPLPGVCFDAGVIPPGGVVTVTVNCIGPIVYHCHIHPNMRASVNVWIV